MRRFGKIGEFRKEVSKVMRIAILATGLLVALVAVLEAAAPALHEWGLVAAPAAAWAAAAGIAAALH